ncbi:MAG: hypothetical protein IPM68_03130 [Flavobacteriales bacterium]|nr:hypothetical protein [Flavobacteriales bacterium]
MAHGFDRIPGRESRMVVGLPHGWVELMGFLRCMGFEEIDALQAGLLKHKGYIHHGDHYHWHPSAKGRRWLHHDRRFDLIWVRPGKGAFLFAALQRHAASAKAKAVRG